MEALVIYWDQFIHFMNAGGIIMWVLFALNLPLWYGLGYRYFTLKRGTKGNVRRLIEKHESRGDEKVYVGILDYAIHDALKASRIAKSIAKKPREYIYDALFPYIIITTKYSVLIKTVVMLAPLIGLLGTVSGMIETFDALQSSSMFAQGDSIAGGISKALFTTELGLVVAVPGLIFGKILDRKEEQFTLEFEQIVDIISTKDEK
ncbi:MotA/TolQ/ExbB proton channel family protein [Sulfurimonas sp. SAG-AH-194-L11]|nr:MotA/TolQ/ExbB proton channel family protein [Sulfurimonas sp. SAG-AH-194-L11]MDF1877196.1 MotA/TolQ/ExbB proton channel family protein [Sulfurimonas sp. SAG-AH-194-L11]